MPTQPLLCCKSSGLYILTATNPSVVGYISSFTFTVVPIWRRLPISISSGASIVILNDAGFTVNVPNVTFANIFEYALFTASSPGVS